jgi:hypothetical protein
MARRAANDGSERNNSIITPRLSQPFAGYRKLKRAGHPRDVDGGRIDPVTAQTVLGPLKQTPRNQVIPAADNDRKLKAGPDQITFKY